MDIDENAMVKSLVKNTHAANSGIRIHDKIISINMQHVTTGTEIHSMLKDMDYVVFMITREYI